MKAQTILEAIEALDKARDALTRGDLSIKGQIDLGSRCFHAAFRLRREFQESCTEVEIKK